MEKFSTPDYAFLKENFGQFPDIQRDNISYKSNIKSTQIL